jgi:hypothetical protein
MKLVRKPNYKIYSLAQQLSVRLELLLISEQKVDVAFRLLA